MQTNLFLLREYHNLYQKDIANILGISQRVYSSYETGIKIIPLKHLNKLSNYYNVSIDYILKLNNNKNYSNNINIDELNLRKNNNLTLRKLAEKLNTTSSTISAYETGKTLILTAFAYQICNMYNVSMDWLCGKLKTN